MNQAKFYYPNGCTFCNGGEIIFNESSFVYKCQNCGAYASAHRTDSDFARKYTPYQNLASPIVNSLRRQLEDVFNAIWQTRLKVKDRYEIESAAINIIYRSNIRTYENPTNYVQVLSFDKRTDKANIFSFATNDFKSDVVYSDLGTVTNREKAYAWLASELNMLVEDCKIGYLTELQLLKSIEICTNSLNYAKSKAIK